MSTPTNIGQAASRAGVSAKMVRHYEAIGLLPKIGRTDSGYRQYTDVDIHTLRFIKRSRDLGFSMAEIAQLLKLWQNRRRASADVKRMALRHVDDLEDRIAAMVSMKNVLQTLAEGCQETPGRSARSSTNSLKNTDDHIRSGATRHFMRGISVSVIAERGSPLMHRPQDAAFLAFGESRLDELQRHAFSYFLHETHETTGLVADTSRQGSPASIAAVGFALSAYPVAVERGWLPRDEATRRTLMLMRFFWKSPQGTEADATGHKGFYYHFLDMSTGRRAGLCELSTIDSTFLLAGMLAAAQYFDCENEDEQEIRTLADALYRRADWSWACDGGATVTHGWTPERGFLPFRWQGYDEALLLYVLGLGSPTHPLPTESYVAWASTYEWKETYGHACIYGGPLFIHQYSHVWLDMRGIQDEYLRGKGIDYFENSRRATYIQQAYAIRNPFEFTGYGANFWGLTASDGPGDITRKVHGIERTFFDYVARGAPYGPDDGTIAPWAVLTSLPFAPEIVLPTVQHLQDVYPRSTGEFCFRCSINLSFSNDADEDVGWTSPYHFGINLGPVVLMVENYRSGMLWRLMRASPMSQQGCVGPASRMAGFDVRRPVLFRLQCQVGCSTGISGSAASRWYANSQVQREADAFEISVLAPRTPPWHSTALPACANAQTRVANRLRIPDGSIFRLTRNERRRTRQAFRTGIDTAGTSSVMSARNIAFAVTPTASSRRAWRAETRFPGASMKTSAIEVHDMLSVFSVDEVEKRIGEVPGVESVTVNFAAGNATVRYDETQLKATGIKSAVRQRGFEPAAPQNGSAGENHEGHPAEAAPPATPTLAAPAASPVAAETGGLAASDKSAAPPTPASSSSEPTAEPAGTAGNGKLDKAAPDKS